MQKHTLGDVGPTTTSATQAEEANLVSKLAEPEYSFFENIKNPKQALECAISVGRNLSPVGDPFRLSNTCDYKVSIDAGAD